jgi:hypothetical protein
VSEWRVACACAVTCNASNLKGNFRKEWRQSRRHVHVTSGDLIVLYCRIPWCRNFATPITNHDPLISSDRFAFCKKNMMLIFQKKNRTASGGTGWLRNRASISSFLQSAQNDCISHPTSYYVTVSLSPRAKWAGREADHTPHLVLSLKMRGAIRPLSHMPSWRSD